MKISLSGQNLKAIQNNNRREEILFNSTRFFNFIICHCAKNMMFRAVRMVFNPDIYVLRVLTSWCISFFFSEYQMKNHCQIEFSNPLSTTDMQSQVEEALNCPFLLYLIPKTILAIQYLYRINFNNLTIHRTLHDMMYILLSIIWRKKCKRVHVTQLISHGQFLGFWKDNTVQEYHHQCKLMRLQYCKGHSWDLFAQKQYTIYAM